MISPVCLQGWFRASKLPRIQSFGSVEQRGLFDGKLTQPAQQNLGSTQTSLLRLWRRQKRLTG